MWLLRILRVFNASIESRAVSRSLDFTLPNVENIFNTTNVDIHRRFRRLLSSPISESGLKLMYPQIASKVHHAIQLMSEEMETRRCTDISKWWIFMTTDIIGELTFGESFRMLECGQVRSFFSSSNSCVELTDTLVHRRTTMSAILKCTALLALCVLFSRTFIRSSRTCLGLKRLTRRRF